MPLSAESNLMLAATSVALVGGTYAIAMPSMADTRALPGNQPDIDSSERNATWIAAGVVSVMSLLAKSPEILVVGGLAVIGFAWSYKVHSKKDDFQEAARQLITPAESHTPSGVTMAGKQETTQLTMVSGGSAF